jgi:mono/diheme cytochrome c family protein
MQAVSAQARDGFPFRGVYRHHAPGELAMIRKLFVLAAAFAVIAVAALWFLTIPKMIAENSLPPRTADLANGKTMFYIGGCASCHAVPKQEDQTRLAGGLALASPFGTFYVPNISPDPKDGIGAWTEAQFVTAMMKGTSPGGQHLFPALPYTSYQRMRVEDLRDMFAYLKTLPAVAGRVRDHDLRFPFNIRRGVGVWKLLFLDGKQFQPDPKQPAEWNRGAYLVNGPGHCAECHSPRNFLGAIVESKRFSGGPSPDGQGGVPNITQAKLGKWTVEDFAFMLEDAQTPDAGPVGGAMIDVVRNIAHVSKEDRMAIGVYLKSLPPVEGAAKK